MTVRNGAAAPEVPLRLAQWLLNAWPGSSGVECRQCTRRLCHVHASCLASTPKTLMYVPDAGLRSNSSARSAPSSSPVARGSATWMEAPSLLRPARSRCVMPPVRMLVSWVAEVARDELLSSTASGYVPATASGSARTTREGSISLSPVTAGLAEARRTTVSGLALGDCVTSTPCMHGHLENCETVRCNRQVRAPLEGYATFSQHTQAHRTFHPAG